MLEITRVAVGHAAVLCGCDTVSEYSVAAAMVDNETNNLLLAIRVVGSSYKLCIEVGERQQKFLAEFAESADNEMETTK